MRERAFTFGHDAKLVGILTEPEAACRIASAPMMMVSNVGRHHRVGPFRLYVDLARALAEKGFATFRFDQAGLGDSEPRRDDRSDAERAIVDLQEAMAFAGTRGASTFVVMGLCSGVDNAHSVTRSDARVRGAVFVDGYAYRTALFPFYQVRRRLLEPRRFRINLERRARLWAVKLGIAPPAPEDPEAFFRREYPTCESFRSDLIVATDRGTKLLFIYSGGVDYSYNHDFQFFDMVKPLTPGLRTIEAAFMPEADHVFTRPKDREALVSRVAAFMVHHYAK